MAEILADLVNLSKKRGYKKYIILALQDPKNRKALRKCIDNYKHYGGVEPYYLKEYERLKAEAARLRPVVEAKKVKVVQAELDLRNQKVTTDGLKQKYKSLLNGTLRERRGLEFPNIATPDKYPGIFEKEGNTTIRL